MTLILDVNREIVGEFPGSFPFDPPDTFDVIFTDWHEYYPFRVEFCVHANGMHGPEHPAPLYWNARIGKFQDSPP